MTERGPLTHVEDRSRGLPPTATPTHAAGDDAAPTWPYLLAALLINVGVWTGVFYAPESIMFADVTAATTGAGTWWDSIGHFVGTVFALNLLLFVFNLLPLPPLDGSAAAVLVLPEDTVPKYQAMLWSHPQLALMGIMVGWMVFDLVFDPIFTVAISWLYPGVTYGP